jgi:threonine dehydrogenase-like Zn-dependent dehydrogenase
MGRGATTPNTRTRATTTPWAIVRWTEQRNFEAVLDMMADGRLDVKPLISHRFDIAQAEAAYAVVGGAEAVAGHSVGVPAR